MGRRLVIPLVIAIGFIVGAGGTAIGVQAYSSGYRFHQAVPSGGFLEECAMQFAWTDPDYVIGSQRGSGGAHTSTNASSGGTCNVVLNRSYAAITATGTLKQTNNGTQCSGGFTGYNSSGTNQADSYDISRGYAGSCSLGSTYFEGWGFGQYLVNGSYDTGPCCMIAPSKLFPAQ